MKAKGNNLYEIIDPQTGEWITFNRTTTGYDGTTITNLNEATYIDNVIYVKLSAANGGGYAKRAISGNLDINWFWKSGDTNWAAAMARACSAATRLGVNVYAPAKEYDLGPTFSMNGYKNGIVGDGDKTIFKATAQTGPVLDFTGWISPAQFLGRVPFKRFAIKGDGTSGAAKKGIKMKSNYTFHMDSITVSDTGGEPIDLEMVYFSTWDRVVVKTPIDAKLNNVPYFRAKACNGNIFTGVGIRSVTATNDCGASGAVVVSDNGTLESHSNTFNSWWFENIHVPSGGCLFSHAGNLNKILDFQLFDCLGESGATDTCVFKFTPSVVNNYGGNDFRGIVYGRSLAVDAFIYGVKLLQNGNRIDGVKGYKGYNVYLGAGVERNSIKLSGTESDATNPAFVDESGNLKNFYEDATIPGLARINSVSAGLFSFSPAVNDSHVILPQLTRAGNFGLLAALRIKGKSLTVSVENKGQYSWALSDDKIKDTDGFELTKLDNQTTYNLRYDGTAWHVVSKTGYKKYNPTWQSGNVAKKSYISKAGEIAVSGMFTQQQSSTAERLSVPGEILKDHVKLSAGYALGVIVDTSYYKVLRVYSLTKAGAGTGRLVAAAYDVNGNNLNDLSGNHPYVEGDGFYGSAIFGYAYTAGVNGKFFYELRLKPEVAYIRLFENSSTIQSLSIEAVTEGEYSQPLNVYTNFDHLHNRKHIYADPATLKGSGLIRVDDTFVLGELTYKCTTAGINAKTWTASTVFEEGQYRENDTGKVYVCKVGGTSAASGGPVGTTTGIVDGTVTWDYTGYGLPQFTSNTATTTKEGLVKQAAAQPDSTAIDVAGIVADYNALLAKLRTAGILTI